MKIIALSKDDLSANMINEHVYGYFENFFDEIPSIYLSWTNQMKDSRKTLALITLETFVSV